MNYMHMCTVKGYDILKDKNILGKSVNYVTECPIKKSQYSSEVTRIKHKMTVLFLHTREVIL